MIKVTVELYPYGEEAGKSILSTVEIINTTRTSNPDTYEVLLDGTHKGYFRHNRLDGINMCVGRAFQVINAGGLTKW